MRLQAVVAVFVTISISHSEAILDEDVVKWISNSIGKTQRSLGEHKRQLSDDQKSLLNDFNKAKADAVTFAGVSIQKLAEDLEKARDEKKNVGECSESLKSGTENARNKQLVKLDKCFNTYSPDLNALDDRIGGLLTEGEELQGDLKGMHKDCKSKIFEWLCLGLRLPQIKYSEIVWKAQASTARKPKHRGSSMVKAKFSECVAQSVTEFKEDLSGLNIIARMCIAAAPVRLRDTTASENKDPPTPTIVPSNLSPTPNKD